MDIDLLSPSSVDRDPEYDFVSPLPKRPPPKKGKQCGLCGMKFEYGKAYGYCCIQSDCPCGWNR